MGYFVWWFARKEHIGFAPLYALLLLALVYKFLRILHEWYHYWDIRVTPRPASVRSWSVDMLTTFYPGEPYEMIVETLEAMVAVTYPHTTYLCDEGDDPFLKQKCAELGVVHVTRTVKKDAKAGNINHALQQATGEICVILDPDHTPAPDFLDRVLPYFEDTEIGYVQCVQAYKNRNESFIAKGAAQQTYHFYGPMMMSMNTYGTAQAIGANCTFRRAALDSIGGHAAGLSEDMHTSMRIHAEHWKSVYLPEALTRGLVPSSLSAYYKQQLKWSRGTFDLLLHVFPTIAGKFTLRQWLHYFTLPFFYLTGLITLIDLVVPIVSLSTARSPWFVDFGALLQAALPLLLLVMFIRQYVQRWLLEEHERGFHFIGGALLAGTWWVFITGFVYTLLNIKVPYIPTPKEGTEVNEWKLSLPNIIACVLSLFAMIYGLSIDWSPYSMIMAGFAATNIFNLGFVVLISQQKMISGFYHGLYKGGLARYRLMYFRLRHSLIYRPLRKAKVAFPMILAAVVLSTTLIEVDEKLDLSKGRQESVEQVNRLYLGQEVQAAGQVAKADAQDWPLSLISWDMEHSPSAPMAASPALQSQGTALMLRWTPGVCTDLLSGKLDTYLREEARALRDQASPIVVTLVLKGAGSQEQYAEAWRYVVEVFRSEACAQVFWNWDVTHVTPDSTQAYPGKYWVDYLGWNTEVSVMNLDSLSRNLRQRIARHPVIVTAPAEAWQQRAGLSPESGIQALVLRGPIPAQVAAPQEGNAPARRELASIGQSVGELVKRKEDPLKTYLGRDSLPLPNGEASLPATPRTEAFFRKTEEGYAFWVDGAPFYIKGVSYNASNDWRDGSLPLTKLKLTQDFTKLTNIGCNTLRRYHPSIYDYNLIHAAEVHQLKVLYGFWFDPGIDYYKDSEAVDKYVRDVTQKVAEWKDSPVILGWNLGNEAWSQMQEHFDPIYLPAVRRAYIQMIEEIAANIRKTDPRHPVLISLAHTSQLPAQVREFRKYAPSVDILGINSFYEERISHLDSVMQVLDPGQPYLVSEFGPEGYWKDFYTERDAAGFIIEPSDYEKADHYYRKWTRYIEPHRGHNIGGFAYCWQDRWEGTATWFGISTIDGKVRPAYYALLEAWTGENYAQDPFLFDLYLAAPQAIPGIRPYLPFWAISENNVRRKDLTYDWVVRDERTFAEAGRIKLLEDGKIARVQMPLPPGNYRMYLTITDKRRHAVTASRPFTVTPEMIQP
ncbi:MAG: glycosyltransferase [Bacteroidetes bacterium]|nr:MAG: glycosyltransferase [Bacteroidota bacterium]